MSYPKFDQPKDPEDITDWTVDFSEAMSVEDAINEIDRVTLIPVEGDGATPPDGTDLLLLTKLYTQQGVVLWLSGGADGWQYEVGVLVKTFDGRSLQRRMLLTVKLQ